MGIIQVPGSSGSPQKCLKRKTLRNPTFGNDTVARYGAEVRRVILHQTDLAQPYIRLQPGTVDNNSVILPGTSLAINWQVNGSMVVDHTSIQWGTNPIQSTTRNFPPLIMMNTLGCILGDWVGCCKQRADVWRHLQ